MPTLDFDLFQVITGEVFSVALDCAYEDLVLIGGADRQSQLHSTTSQK